MLFYIINAGIRLGVCPCKNVFFLAFDFSWNAISCRLCNDFSTLLMVPLRLRLSDSLTFRRLVCDEVPFQLAGGLSFLQRQIVLPAVHVIDKPHGDSVQSCEPCAAFLLCCRQSWGHFVAVDDARCGHDTGFFEILALQRIFFDFLCDKLWQLVLHLGVLAVQFFQTWLAVTCAYLVKLLCFAVGLRGEARSYCWDSA